MLVICLVGQGIGMLDGFFVWYYFDVNGICFKSIMLQKDGLLIKFDFIVQGVVVKEVFGCVLLYGYIIVFLEDDNLFIVWLFCLCDVLYCFG